MCLMWLKYSYSKALVQVIPQAQSLVNEVLQGFLFTVFFAQFCCLLKPHIFSMQ